MRAKGKRSSYLWSKLTSRLTTRVRYILSPNATDWGQRQGSRYGEVSERFPLVTMMWKAKRVDTDSKLNETRRTKRNEWSLDSHFEEKAEFTRRHVGIIYFIYLLKMGRIGEYDIRFNPLEHSLASGSDSLESYKPQSPIGLISQPSPILFICKCNTTSPIIEDNGAIPLLVKSWLTTCLMIK